MADTREKALQYAAGNRPQFLKQLKELISIPTISTDPEHVPDLKRGAEWIADKLRQIGLENVATMPTDGPDVVYGESMEAGPDAPTMLVYGHYDVQPADPLEMWESEPFEATQRGDNLYARGASDMKGQVMASIFAIEAVKGNGGLPVNVKFMIEGEEEVGSGNLEVFTREQKELLACDFALNPDAGMIAPDLPTITYALRGLAYFEINLTGPNHDLHSGQYGGAVRNPANELARLIAGMHDEKRRVTLPGFYDSVRALDKAERAELSRLPMDEEFYLKQTGAPVLWGEEGYTPVERTSGRPTLDVNGLFSGYTGEGSKTVLPAKAMAKVSMRLVPDQTPEEVHEQLVQYMEENAHPGVTWEVEMLSKGPASISARDSAESKALSAALETVWGVRPLYKREGGTIPIVAYMQNVLGAESLLTGFSLPDDAIHSPNEKVHLPTLYKGIDALIHFICNLAG